MESLDNQIVVSIQCLTYNHAQYIRQCLDGIVMQKTKFPFVAIVVDDASSDNEPKILWDFVNNELDLNTIQKDETDDYVKVVAPHKTNHNCTFVILFLKYNHYYKKPKYPYYKDWYESAKYIALCEGDDFWTDPLKLQKQVDALESHPKSTICFGNVKVVSPEGENQNWNIPVNQSIKSGIIELGDYTKEQFAKRKWVFQTSSYVYKTSLLKGFLEIRKKDFKEFPYGDIPLVLYYLMQGNGYYISDEMSCYRWHVPGSWTKTNTDDKKKQIDTSKKLIKSLHNFDKLTSFHYHNHIKTKILQQEYSINECSEKVFSLLLPKFWRLYNKYDLKHIPYMIIKKYILNTFKK